MKQLTEGSAQLAPPRIPGSATDDWTAVKILFLRRHDLDQSARVETKVEEQPAGCSWRVRFSALGRSDERTASSPTAAVQEMRRDYARFLVQRARSDLAVLGLAGERFTPRDEEEPAVIDAEPAEPTGPGLVRARPNGG